MATKLPDLSGFTGSETFYRHALNRKVTYTEGVQYLAVQCGAYWLIDKIAIMQLDPTIRAQEFQVWKIKVEASTADITVEDGNGNAVYREHLDFTDFPDGEIAIWFVNQTILLPSEY